MHRFRYNQVLPFVGNDVIVLSPLGGAVSDFFTTDSERATLTLYHVALTFCVYLEPLKSYSTLSIWLGFQHLGLYWGSFFGDATPQKCSDI